MDIISLCVVSWVTADHLQTELIADALRAACRTRRLSGEVAFRSAPR